MLAPDQERADALFVDARHDVGAAERRRLGRVRSDRAGGVVAGISATAGG
jgi:hypothetical protein